MNRALELAAVGLIFVGSVAVGATPEDYSVAINPAQTGIDEYAITEKGASLVAGSPFAPTKFPYKIPQGLPVLPVMAQISQGHHYVYAVYEEESGIPNILVQFAVNPTGLVENWTAVTDFDGADDLNHVAYLQSVVSTANEVIVYYHYPWGLSAQIFSSSGKVLGKATSDPSGEPVLQSVQVDPNANFYYACFTNAGQAYVSIFNLPEGKLLQNSTDPVFIASECN